MAEEWSLIEVREDFKPNTIFNVRFFGKVSIGSLNGRIEIEEGFEMKCGLRNATLRDVEIGDYCLIDNVGGYISNYEIKDSVLISNVGVITTHGCPNYGNGNSVALLNEAGDGNVVIHDKLTAQTAQLMMDHPSVYAMVQQEQLKGVEKFHSVDSFRQYLINIGIKDVPSNSTISGRYGCLRHKFPDWVFSDGCDATEAQRRINIAKRFLCLFLKGK
jgi:hypothetical protein